MKKCYSFNVKIPELKYIKTQTWTDVDKNIHLSCPVRQCHFSFSCIFGKLSLCSSSAQIQQLYEATVVVEFLDLKVQTTLTELKVIN